MADIGKLFDVVKKLVTTPTHRFIIGEATSDITPRATIIYDDKTGSPSEGLTFTIPEDNNPPPPPPGCLPSECKDPITGQCRLIAIDEIVDANGFCKKKDIPPPQPIKAVVTSVVASKQDAGKEADKTIDNNFETRWSADGIGEWIEFTFNQPYKIQTVKLTGFHYDKSYTFEINGSTFVCPANRTPNTLIEFDVSSLNIDSNKVRIVGKGNSGSTYNSYREIEFWGFPGTPPPARTVIKPDNPAGIPGQTIALDGSESTGKPPLKYFWTTDITPNTLTILNPDSVTTGVQISSSAQPGTSATVTLTVTDGDGVPLMAQKQVSIVGTPPPPPPPPGLTARLVAFADNDTTSGAKAVLTQIMKVENVSEYDFVGDGPYSESGTKWVNMMKEYFNTPDKVAKLRISQGNHDHRESESNQTEQDIENWIPSLNKSPEGLDWTSSGQVGNVYVISGNTQDMDVEFKRDQFNWLSTELQKAKQLRAAGTIDWIVYLAHKPFFTLKTSHSPYTAVRNNYKDIFRDAQVDFVLHGHNHNTQLWLPMIPNQSDANGEGQQLFTRLPDGTFDFSRDHGQAYIITGHSGHEWNKINDSGSGVQNVMHFRDSGKFGFTQLDFNGKKATIKSINSDGQVHFEYKVSREGGSPPPPPPPTCPAGQCIDPITRQCRNPTADETIDPNTGECKLTSIPPPPPGELWNSTQDLNQNVTVDGNNFVPNSLVIGTTRAGQGDKKFKVSNGEISWTGVRTRIYNFFFRLPGISENATKNIEFEFFAKKTSSSGNISVKCGNHGTDLFDDLGGTDWSFGGYGISWHDKEAQSKVEFYHNDHGSEEQFNLPKSIPTNQYIGYKHQWQTVKGKKEKVLNAWIKYPGEDWLHVVKNRKWTSWTASGAPSGKKDSDGVKNGPYLGKMHHAWIRNNEVGTLTVKDMVFRELQEAEI